MRKRKLGFNIPSPKKAVKIGLSLGAIGLGVHYLNKLSGGN